MRAWSMRSQSAALQGLMSMPIVRAAAAGSFAAFLALSASLPAAGKTPGSIHCFGGFCHRVNTVDEMDGMVGRRGMVIASYYDDCRRDHFNPCGLTSSGAVFRADLADNAASPIFPDGTILLTYNHDTKLAAVVRVTNAGPYRGDRKLDVSRATAERLGFSKRGVTELEIVVVRSPDAHEARYSRRRTYTPVPGFLGKFATFDAAHDAAVAQLRLEMTAVRVAAARPPSAADDHRNATARGEISSRPGAPIPLPLSRMPPAVITDVREDIIFLANESREITSVAAIETEVSAATTFASLINRVAEFIVAARKAARLGSKTTASSRASGSEVMPSFLDRARAIVHAAKMSARLRPDAHRAYSDLAIGRAQAEPRG